MRQGGQVSFVSKFNRAMSKKIKNEKVRQLRPVPLVSQERKECYEKVFTTR